MRWKQKTNFLLEKFQSIHQCILSHVLGAIPNSNICFGYASLATRGGGGGENAAARPAKLRWPMLAVHGAPPGVPTNEQLLGLGGPTGRRCCNNGSRRFWPFLSHCVSSSSRIRVASNGFMVRNTDSIILTNIAFLDIILFCKQIYYFYVLKLSMLLRM